MTKFKYVYLIFLFTLFNSSHAFGDSMFDFLKIYMASEFSGTLTDGGQPLSGIQVKRFVSDGTDSKEKEQETHTDSNGNFHFDEVTGHSPSKFLPFEMRFHSKIVINYNNELIKVFSTTKSNTSKGGEFSNMDSDYNVLPVNLNFNCELTNSDDVLKEANGEYFGICRIIK